MNQQSRLYAVLTGDLVKSSKLSGDLSSEAMKWLRKASVDFTGLYPQSVIGKIDTFRHDSWQLLIGKPQLALRAAVFFRAALKKHSSGKIKYDTRIAVGIGTVEKIAASRISDSRGIAFSLSGKCLDTTRDMRIAYQTSDDLRSLHRSISRVLVPLLDCVVSDWTPKESEAVWGALQGWTQEEIAEKSPINPKTGKSVTRQAISIALERAHWGTVEMTLQYIESENSKLWSLQ